MKNEFIITTGIQDMCTSLTYPIMETITNTRLNFTFKVLWLNRQSLIRRKTVFDSDENHYRANKKEIRLFKLHENWKY